MRKDLLVYTLGLLFISSTVCGQAVKFSSLLKEMSDNDGLARFPDPSYRQLQSSSYNRASESPFKSGWFADSDGTGYIREETISGRKEYVIMEHNGPGCITRMWTPFFYYSMDDRTGPNIRVYIDGEKTPVLEDNFIRLLTGGSFVHPPFATLTARAGVLYLPIPFARSCKVTLDQKPFYYCISYRSYAEDVKVRSFTMKDYRHASDLLSRVGGELEHPSLPDYTSKASLHRMLQAGDSARLLLAGGSGAIRYLQFKLDTPLHDGVLRNILLKISFDGHQTIWCPLGDFFCSADQVNTFHTAAISVHSGNTLVSRWVMPYKDSAVIMLVNYAGSDIAMSLEAGADRWDWDDRSMYFHADWCNYGYLPGNKFFDLNFITTKGRGVLTGDALTVLSPGTGWWGEGDEKIYISKSDIARHFPSQFGTGTEDYYGWAGGVVPTGKDTFSIPFGANVKVGNKDNPRGYNICTRNRILDAIPFDDALRFDMEASPGVDIRKAYNLLAYSMITYWYGSPGAISNRTPDTRKIKEKIMSLSGLDALEEGLKSGDILLNDHAVEEKVQALGHSPD